MGNSAKATRENRPITVDFQEQSTYCELLSDGKAFVEFVLAFLAEPDLEHRIPNPIFTDQNPLINR